MKKASPIDPLRVMKHQLKGPLTIIRGYLSFWESNAYAKFPPEKQREFLLKAAEAARKLDTLITDSFSVLLLEAKKIKPVAEQFPLKPLIEEIYAESKTHYQTKNLSFTIETVPGPIEIQTDRALLKQALEKIIDNALKYTAQGSVRIILKVIPRRCIIEITDSGSGFSAEEQKLAFTKFFHGSLSLYLAHHIIQLLKGTVAISASSLSGTTVAIQLPQ